MASIAQVTIHSSQFPAAVSRDLRESLRARRINHKFHYDSIKQTQKWLALHQAYSPSRKDAGCAEAYTAAFVAVVGQVRGRTHLIGLGCGGGQKDTRLLKLLQKSGHKVAYTPADVSAAMTLAARDTALSVVSDEECHPLVCDLATAGDLGSYFDTVIPARTTRIITFFGMIPNFEPSVIMPRLAGLVRPGDYLLFSANLAPGKDYAAGVKKVLPQYDNSLTRDWLMTLLRDLGVERRDGKLVFSIQTGAVGLKRIVAEYHFARACQIELERRSFKFGRGETLRLFFSYRYTPELARKLLERNGLKICGEWLANSGEEGVFCAQRRES